MSLDFVQSPANVNANNADAKNVPSKFVGGVRARSMLLAALIIIIIIIIIKLCVRHDIISIASFDWLRPQCYIITLI